MAGIFSICGFKGGWSLIIELRSEPELQKLREAVEKHCPVMDTLIRPIPVRGKVYFRQFLGVPVL
jgi:hypothetical protein